MSATFLIRTCTEHFSRFCQCANTKDLTGDVFKINIFSSLCRVIHSEMTDVNKTIITYLSEAPSTQQLTQLIKEKTSFTAPFSRLFPLSFNSYAFNGHASSFYPLKRAQRENRLNQKLRALSFCWASVCAGGRAHPCDGLPDLANRIHDVLHHVKHLWSCMRDQTADPLSKRL